MEIIPPHVKELWDEWGIRLMVIISLLLQVILIIIGNRRKIVAVTRVRFILWFAYLSADWFATVALGALSNKMGNDFKATDHDKIKNQLLAFWAPFLLLHLGGPDTITAYALEDNELWLRHFLGLIVQSIVAVYIFLVSWRSSQISFIGIPMFLAGFIKYGERTWVLRSASREHFRDAMLNPPDPGPNIMKVIEGYNFKRAEGFRVSIRLENEDPTGDANETTDANAIAKEDISQHEILLSSFKFFGTFKRLFADLILSFEDRDNSRKFFLKRSPVYAFKVIELELGFIYDVLYTKANIIYSHLGRFLRFVSFSSTVLAFVFFVNMEKHGYANADVSVTYLLLVVAILLEIYAIFLLISSDWTIIWSIKHKKDYSDSGFLRSYFHPDLSRHRWSNKMAQYNLISFCIKDRMMVLSSIYKFLRIDDLVEKYHYKRYREVPEELKNLIFQQLEQKYSHDATRKLDLRRRLSNCRGNHILEYNKCLDIFGWSTEVEFDQSILLWHIATDLCYYSDPDNVSPRKNLKMKMGKTVSDYMLYLLVMRPFMLPNGIGQIRFRDTCAEAIEFFKEKIGLFNNKVEACRLLINVQHIDIESVQKVKGDKSKSVLFDACRLAKLLQTSEIDKWEVISHVWVEMLCYAASHCRGNFHARQLGRGGELLTHVWLLMAHLGITEQFQISEGDIKVKFDFH